MCCCIIILCGRPHWGEKEIRMKIEVAKKMSYENLKKDYASFLKSQDLGRNTISTMATDSFYIWNNLGKDEFWRIIESENFEHDAKSSLIKALSENSKGNIDQLINGYLSQIRKLKNFIYSENFNPIEVNEEKIIKEFLLDIECLDALSKWTDKFNLFDVLKITRTEIRHSNMLAWLLSPDENHGLEDKILKGVIQYIVKNFSDNKDVFSTLLMNFHSFVIFREWHNIDLLAVSEDEKFILCIENKIDTGEHDNQLHRYKEIVEKNFPDYKAMYIYLTPQGDESSDSEHWYSMSYQDVLAILERNCKKTDLSADSKFLIENYIDIIRRDIVEDEELAKICRDIYHKHQKALDLIFENRPDKSSELADLIKSWALEKDKNKTIIFDNEHSGKTYIRFRTAEMDKLIPDSKEKNSGWKTPNHYFFEIKNNDGKEFSIQFVLSSENKTEEQSVVFDKINQLYPSKQQKDNWLWRTHFASKHCKIEDDINEEKILDQLDKQLNEVLEFQQNLIIQLKP